MAGSSDVNPCVTCDWLHSKITAGQPADLVVLDVSWSSQKDCQAEFRQRHIPGARYLNVLAADHTDLFPRNIPTPDAFQESVRAVGVNEDSHVILYSDTDINGFFLSGRAWWTFKVYGAQHVSILNGGLQKWLSLGLPTTPDTTTATPGDFTARNNSQYRLSFEEMSELVGSGAAILDSRAKEKYNEGHIPQVVNFPASQLVDPKTQEMRSPDDVREALKKVGVDTAKPLTTYCNSGMSSCTLAFAYAMCGGTDFAVYHGGFTEWKNRGKIEKS